MGEDYIKMISTKFCPQCGGDNIVMVAGGEIGMWKCVDCGFTGSIFPEKAIISREEGVKSGKDKLSRKGGKK